MRKVLFIHDGPRWKDTKGTQYGTKADLDMCARYSYLGDQVEFVMRVFKTDDTSKLIDLNENGLYINEIVPFNRPVLLKNYLKSKKQIIDHVEKADVLVIRLPSTIGSVALNYAKKISKPYIVELVACPWDSLRNHSTLGIFYAPFSYMKLKNLVVDARFVIYVTNRFLQDRYPTKFNNISLSDVVLYDFPKINYKQISYKNFDLQKKITITTLGVVNLAYKGQQYVLKAMSSLIFQGYDLFYIIVGGGDNSQLKCLANKLGLQDRVVFLGKIAHNEIFKVLEETDLYIQPSETEGMPRSLIEAMSRGCACIGSNAGGIPELLDKSVIFKSKNVESLKSTIKSLLIKEKMVEHSIKNFEQAKNFEFEVLDSKRKVFYDKFLKSLNEK